MNVEPPYDPRGVANLLLDVADSRSRIVTNLALQKLMYFAHAIFLINNKIPLVSGYFEAWQHGPVHPVLYKSFRSAGASPIKFRAFKTDLLTGEVTTVPAPESQLVRDLASRIMDSYGLMTPGRLVDVSHAKNGPWDFVVSKAKESMAFGMRIPDSVIAERFKYHKVSVSLTPRNGEPREDTPLA